MSLRAPGASLLCCLAAVHALGIAAEVRVVEAPAARTETMVLRVTLNTEEVGDLFVGRTAEGDFLVKIEDLRSMGFREPIGTRSVLDGEPHLSLRSMPGVTYAFRQRTLVLDISADPHLLAEHAITLRGERRRRGVIAQGSSGFLNYALNYSNGSGSSGSRLGFAGEVGWSYRDFLFLTDASTSQNGGAKPVRLMSSLTHDNRDTLRRTVVGDFFSPAREFGNGVNLGGISLSKLYTLDPYLVSVPTQSITGNVALPSDLEVYLDGQRISSERLRPGEFELRDILAYGGSRNVQLVLRDAFGRVQQLNYSFYFSDQPLKQGLNEYSYNIGALRRNFGSDSANYGPLAYSAFHRYGVTNALTLGLRAEGTRKLSGLGASGTLVAGAAGVINITLAASSIEGRRGAAGSLGYNYQSKNWNVGVSARRDWGEFATLGLPVTISSRKYEVNAVIGVNLAELGSLALSHSALGVRTAQPDPAPAPAPASDSSISFLPMQKRDVTALTYTVPFLSRRMSLTATLSHIKEKAGNRNEAFVSLIYFLDKDYSAAASYRGDNASNAQSVQLTKNQPIGEGLGYVISMDRSGGPDGASWRGKSSVQYNGTAGMLRGEYGVQRDGSTSSADYRLSAAGGVAYVDGNVALGRPVVGSYGIVKVGEVAGVTVLVNNQEMGKTDAHGKLFVPTLSPYYDSDVSLVPSTLPLAYTVPAISKKISPALRSGALIDFGVTKVQAISGALKVLHEGSLQAVENHEATLMQAGKPLHFLTGRGGEFYLENIPPGTYSATIQLEGKPCVFDVTVPVSDETFLELGDVRCH